jgi:hypothetical protein
VGLTPKSYSVPDKSLDLTHGPALGTPARDRICASRGNVERRLNADYWRRQPTDHSARGLLEGGPDDFSGTLQDYIADSMSGSAPESPRAALNRMKLRRINAQRKARQRDAFIRAVYAPGYAPRAR